MSSDEMIFIAVVGARLIIPLFVFRFPLPAIVAALVLDAADQTIYQKFTDLPLDNYQGYDKALDIYYLSLAYLSTLRNWSNPFHLNVMMFLWYYRLVGVVVFELSQERWVLLVFPNTFEYVFIAYEVVRLRWNPGVHISHRGMIYLTAFIWIFVKLPQEWWIHVAQLDFTDFMKEDVLGVPVDTSWGEALGENLWFVALLVAVAVGVVFLVRYVLHKAPPPDWKTSVDVDTHPVPKPDVSALAGGKFWSRDLLEKVVLMSLISIIFAQVLGTESRPWQIAVAVAIIVAANAGVTQWLSSRNRTWSNLATEMAAMLVINLGIVIGYLVLLRRADGPVNDVATVFFVILLTLIVTLYDRYRPIREARTSADDPFDTPDPAPTLA